MLLLWKRVFCITKMQEVRTFGAKAHVSLGKFFQSWRTSLRVLWMQEMTESPSRLHSGTPHTVTEYTPPASTPHHVLGKQQDQDKTLASWQLTFQWGAGGGANSHTSNKRASVETQVLRNGGGDQLSGPEGWVLVKAFWRGHQRQE